MDPHEASGDPGGMLGLGIGNQVNKITPFLWGGVYKANFQGPALLLNENVVGYEINSVGQFSLTSLNDVISFGRGEDC